VLIERNFEARSAYPEGVLVPATGTRFYGLGTAARRVVIVIAWMVLGCSEGTSPGEVMAGDYDLRLVHFFLSSRPQPVPGVDVTTLGDSTVVERGDLTLEADGRGFLELVYRWRYNGIPGGETVMDTLSYVFHERAPFLDFPVGAPFPSYPLADWFRLLRGPDHVAYLVRQSNGTVVLTDYDRAGSINFYFQR
jgi:hypothetical protein